LRPGGEEHDVHPVKQLVHETGGMGFVEPGVVALFS
jgi:hypothetical protein